MIVGCADTGKVIPVHGLDDLGCTVSVPSLPTSTLSIDEASSRVALSDCEAISYHTFNIVLIKGTLAAHTQMMLTSSEACTVMAKARL